jgi:hypothetical protein
MSKASFRLTGTTLEPMDDEGRELIASVPPGREVMVRIHLARNPRHHRLLFALFKKLSEAGAWDSGVEELKEHLKWACGLVEFRPDHLGNLQPRTKSIDWESMGQDVFNRWFDRFCYYICERMLLGAMRWEELRDEVIASIEGPGRR